MSNEVYAISDFDGYATEIRLAAAKSLYENDNSNLDEYISLTQIQNLVKDKCLGYDDENRPMLDEKTNEEIYENIVIWIHNVGLAKLAAQDLIECAWSDEENEMVFWAKQREKKSDARKKPRRKDMGDKK